MKFEIIKDVTVKNNAIAGKVVEHGKHGMCTTDARSQMYVVKNKCINVSYGHSHLVCGVTLKVQDMNVSNLFVSENFEMTKRMEINVEVFWC